MSIAVYGPQGFYYAYNDLVGLLSFDIPEKTGIDSEGNNLDILNIPV